MSRELIKRLMRAFTVLAFCTLTSAGLQAAPISEVSPGFDVLTAPRETACIAVETSSSTWAAVFPADPGSPYAFDRSAMDLATVTTGEPSPLSITLLLISAAMIWLAGAIRYSPWFKD